MATPTSTPQTLTALLPSTPFTLAYALPLLVFSIILTFGGAFLTLDRTRSFAPTKDVQLMPGAFDTKKGRRITMILEGGIGGLAIGYAFGVHLSTCLALLIPSTTSSSPIGSKAFIPIWILSALPTTFLGGRFKYAALLFAGISGGTLLSLSLAVILHPSLLTRLVLTFIAIPTLTLMTLLPLPKLQHGALRVSTVATGAFGVVLCIALMSSVEPWSNVWERFYAKDGVSWGSSKEKGLSAAWCLFFVIGCGVDWFLNRRFGENPDKKWDYFLANYAASLPNHADRAGTFHPPLSAWDRLLGRGQAKGDVEDLLLPSEKAKSDTPASRPSYTSQPFNFQQPTGQLKKGEARAQARLLNAGKKKKERVKFGEGYSSSSSEDEEEEKMPQKPWVKKGKSSASDSSITLTNEQAKKPDSTANPPEYSDHEEEDLTTAHVERIKRRVSRDAKGWSPEFLKRHQASSNNSQHLTAPGGAAVPATPSLIKAIERVAIAQRDAFGHDPMAGTPATSSPAKERRPGLPESSSSATLVGSGAEETEKKEVVGEKAPRWEAFWRDVRNKAGEKT